MRALEQAAIESGSVTGLELMERAGRGAVEAILAEWPELAAAPGRAVVLCGPGNNGGDGFVVARVLKERGWDVEVFLYGDPEKLSPDARVNYERWGEMGEVNLMGFPRIEAVVIERLYSTILDQSYSSKGDRSPTGPCDLLIDAIFGTGLVRPPSALWALFDLRSCAGPGGAWAKPYWVALDVPSGLCADSGRLYPAERPRSRILPVLEADLTLTFHAMKIGHLVGRGPAISGPVRIVPIGIEDLDEDELENLFVDLGLQDAVLQAFHPTYTLKQGGHKYDHGHALVLTGGMGRTGAARLAARGALRMGAGLVTLGAPGSAMLECAAQITALMLRRCEDGAALAQVLEDKRLNALCLGPGLGTDARAEGLVAAAVSSDRPAVLDADALTILAGQDGVTLHERCVLTPHGGEFARLFPDLAEKLEAPVTEGPAYSKVDATREAAARVGAVVLFKGPDTVIAAPDGRAAVNAAVYERAAPWLATAGSGDVLAGMIAGLLARGFAPFDAACSAVWLHVEAARLFGPGLIAEDLPEMLPKVFAALEESSS
ncbi:MAG: NAD(P)H-hydrate dehydratase [Pseudomonadota bacterium]